MKHVAFPFLTLDAGSVVAGPWLEVIDGHAATGPGDYLAGWDYARNLRLTRTITLAEDFSASALGFHGEDLQLAVVVRVGTGAGSLPRRLDSQRPVALGLGVPALLDLAIAGEGLAQRLSLETTVILARDYTAVDALAPTMAGAILWRDRHETALEGTAPRFPMEIVSFRERFADRAEAAAPWFLHWMPGHLHRDFGGAVRLFLNHDNAGFIERFVAADGLTLQTTLADVVGQIVGHALRQDDLEQQLADAEPTSVAGHVATWLALAFPGQDIDAVRFLADSAPGRFSAAILAMADPQVMGMGS